jgi:endoglucanase
MNSKELYMTISTDIKSFELKSQKYILQKEWSLLFRLCIIFFLYTTISHSTTYYKDNKNISENDSTVVERHGQLQVQGNKIVDKNGNPVALRGMSLFWSQWEGARFYNPDCIQWLRDDWECTVVRAAMGIDQGGYLLNPDAERNKILTVIDACIDLGIYVIVDWHDHNAQNHQQEAKEFFAEIAELYGDYPNLIYEIFNEPLQVSWTNVIKPYAEAVIDTIRSIDQDNLIIVGTPTWSQDVDIASTNPLEYDNVAYALHFYAATHKQWLRNKATTALNNGIALFVSEWGTCFSNGTDSIDHAEVENWSNFMDQNKLSWCNWSIVDKNETSAALKSGVSSNGGWLDSDLSESGFLVREKIKSSNDTTNTGTGSLDLPLMDFKLYQNYPNPFNPETTVEYTLNEEGQVRFDIFDVKGCRVRTLINSRKNKGQYITTWNGYSDTGTKVSSGVYFFHLIFGNQRQVRKGILLN